MSINRTNSPSYGSREETPPAASCKDHYLFLLEFYVKQASGSRLAKLNKMFFVPTSVSFEFLDFADQDLEVVPVDSLFQPRIGVANNVEIFNAGKSVLFAIEYDTVMDRNAKMILKIVVCKKMPNRVKPNILFGIGELNLSDQYAALRLEMLQCWRKGITTSKVFNGQVPLVHNEVLTGSLDIFVRMSGFGQKIVTEFDAPMPQDPTTFVFGAGEFDQHLAYTCREVDSRTDLFEESSEDLETSGTCPVCVPKRYPCVPCGKMAAVEEMDEIRIEKRESTVASEKKLKRMISRSIIQSSRDPPQLCGKPVVLKVSGLFDNGDGIGKKPTVTVGDGSAATKPDDDPDHDMFVLRIGKKGLVGIGEKSDLQLEMKTPKGPERRPPIRYETREMQTDVDKKKSKKLSKDAKKKKKKKR